jgi:lysophospholipase L1-like esterase
MTYTNHADFVFSGTHKLSLDWIESATFRKINGEWKMNFLSVTTRDRNPANDSTKYSTGHYRKRIALFNSEPVTAGRIIFLGNSITEFGNWQKLLNDPSVVNRGIAGDNTYGVLARLNDITTRKPGKLFIEIGVNDFSLDVPLTGIVDNILAIVRQVHKASPATTIYVTSLLPTNDNVKNDYPFALNKGREEDYINGRLADAAADNNYTYLGVGRLLKDKNGKLDTKYAAPDGIHLNDAGYGLWINFLRSKKYI